MAFPQQRPLNKQSLDLSGIQPIENQQVSLSDGNVANEPDVITHRHAGHTHDHPIALRHVSSGTDAYHKEEDRLVDEYAKLYAKAQGGQLLSFQEEQAMLQAVEKLKQIQATRESEAQAILGEQQQMQVEQGIAPVDSAGPRYEGEVEGNGIPRGLIEEAMYDKPSLEDYDEDQIIQLAKEIMARRDADTAPSRGYYRTSQQDKQYPESADEGFDYDPPRGWVAVKLFGLEDNDDGSKSFDAISSNGDYMCINVDGKTYDSIINDEAEIQNAEDDGEVSLDGVWLYDGSTLVREDNFMEEQSNEQENQEKAGEYIGESIYQDVDEVDHEVNMAQSDLYDTIKNIQELREILEGIDESEGIPAWVQAKLTQASDYINSAVKYLQYEDAKDEGGELEMAYDEDQAEVDPDELDPDMYGDDAMDEIDADEIDLGKRGLWDNIHAKRERGERMREPGEEGAPTAEAFRAAQSDKSHEEYEEDDAIRELVAAVRELIDAQKEEEDYLDDEYDEDEELELRSPDGRRYVSQDRGRTPEWAQIYTTEGTGKQYYYPKGVQSKWDDAKKQEMESKWKDQGSQYHKKEGEGEQPSTEAAPERVAAQAAPREAVAETPVAEGEFDLTKRDMVNELMAEPISDSEKEMLQSIAQTGSFEDVKQVWDEYWSSPEGQARGKALYEIQGLGNWPGGIPEPGQMSRTADGRSFGRSPEAGRAAGRPVASPGAYDTKTKEKESQGQQEKYQELFNEAVAQGKYVAPEGGSRNYPSWAVRANTFLAVQRGQTFPTPANQWQRNANDVATGRKVMTMNGNVMAPEAAQAFGEETTRGGYGDEPVEIQRRGRGRPALSAEERESREAARSEKPNADKRAQRAADRAPRDTEPTGEAQPEDVGAEADEVTGTEKAPRVLGQEQFAYTQSGRAANKVLPLVSEGFVDQGQFQNLIREAYDLENQLAAEESGEYFMSRPDKNAAQRRIREIVENMDNLERQGSRAKIRSSRTSEEKSMINNSNDQRSFMGLSISQRVINNASAISVDVEDTDEIAERIEDQDLIKEKNLPYKIEDVLPVGKDIEDEDDRSGNVYDLKDANVLSWVTKPDTVKKIESGKKDVISKGYWSQKPLEKKLVESSSEEAVGENIGREMDAGKPHDQAVAIALENQRRMKQEGK